MSKEEKESKLKQLHTEYLELKEKLFGNHKFIIAEDTPEQRRYDQLLQLFNPCLRNKDFINPLN